MGEVCDNDHLSVAFPVHVEHLERRVSCVGARLTSGNKPHFAIRSLRGPRPARTIRADKCHYLTLRMLRQLVLMPPGLYSTEKEYYFKCQGLKAELWSSLSRRPPNHDRGCDLWTL